MSGRLGDEKGNGLASDVILMRVVVFDYQEGLEERKKQGLRGRFI